MGGSESKLSDDEEETPPQEESIPALNNIQVQGPND